MTHKNVSGSKLCCHDRGIWAKCADIWLLWQHVTNMSTTFSAKAVAGGGYKEPSFTNSWSPHNKTYLEIFTHFLPFVWLETVLLVMTSAELEREKMAPLMLGEHF